MSFNPDQLHVVTAITNPRRYKARPALYRNFEKMVLDAGATLWLGEGAFGDRKFEVSSPDNPQHFQFRMWDEMWYKENIMNCVINRLPLSAEYIAWVDADILFTRPDWAVETVHMLQHHHVVQMFTNCQDVGPNYEIVPDKSGGEYLPGMVYQHLHGNEWIKNGHPYGKHHGHSGYAWAARREALDMIGGLIDFSICGANDHHMARGFIGNILESIHGASSPGLKAALQVWGNNAKTIREDIGYVNGMITHFWHGRKELRRYKERWKILVDSQFDPHKDIKRDAQGMYQLVDDGTRRFINLRNDLRTYFSERNEDGIDY